MSFDAWVVGFGLSALLQDLRLVPGAGAFGLLASVIAIDLWMLYRFFAITGVAADRPATRTPAEAAEPFGVRVATPLVE